MICKHIFISHYEISKMPPSQFSTTTGTFTLPPTSNAFIRGSLVSCGLCGQVRRVYEDGEVLIVVQGSGNPEHA